MLNFESVENLVVHMFEHLCGDEPVSVVANKDLAVSIVQELLEYDDVILKYANINDWEYDKEYIVTLHDACDADSLDVSIEPTYNYEKEMYFCTDGYVLFHEDVNSKAMLDMQNNEFMPLDNYDWFIIGESVDRHTNNDEEASDGDDYSISVKCNLDVDEALELITEMERRIMHMNDMFREMDNFRRLFNW